MLCKRYNSKYFVSLTLALTCLFSTHLHLCLGDDEDGWWNNKGIGTSNMMNDDDDSSDWEDKDNDDTISWWDNINDDSSDWWNHDDDDDDWWNDDDDDWWNDDDDDDDWWNDDDDIADETKKILIAVGVVGAVLFISCYYCCRKGRKYSGTQEHPTVPGQSGDVGQRPFYEAGPLTNDRGREMPVYTHPTQTVIMDTPNPRQTDAPSVSAAAADQPPPSYANLAPAAPPTPLSPSAPTVSSGDRYSEPSSPPVPPPAYDSLFPDSG